MIQLYVEIGGWLGSLQRVPVLVQLLGLALLLMFYRLHELRRKRAGGRLPHPRLLLLSGIALLVQRLIGISEGSRRALGLVIRYAVVGLGVVAILNRIGFDRTAILTVAGGLSVGLGFGVKEVFSNFISGLWLLFEGSVRPGDVLFIDGDPCEVPSLGLRAAVLWRDRDNAELVIPNQTFFTATTTTYTGSERLRRSQVLGGPPTATNPAR